MDDATGFDDFYRSSFTRVRTAVAAYGVPSEDAFDVTQDAFARALVRWNSLRDAPWREGWVMTTAMNLGRRKMRSKKPRPVRAEAAAAETSLSLDPDVFDAVRALPHRQREAVVLFYLADQPLTVVADLMSVSEGAVKAHLSQARKRLRTQMESLDA